MTLKFFKYSPEANTGPKIWEGGLIPKLRPLFCRVPKRGFSRTPEATRLTHLCRFAVRFPMA